MRHAAVTWAQQNKGNKGQESQGRCM